MSKRESDRGQAGQELARLPAGRHGLPRSFVVRNQRDRLTAGMIAAVAEYGYQEATISRIAAAAGVSRRTFYTYFSSKEECFFATYDRIGEHMLAAAAEAVGQERDWPKRVRAAVAAVLQAFAANPDLVRFTILEPQRTGHEMAERLRLATDRAVALLAEGLPPKVRAPSAEVRRAALAGMANLVARKVEAGEGERLEDLLPELVELFLTPYLGRDKAATVAREA